MNENDKHIFLKKRFWQTNRFKELEPMLNELNEITNRRTKLIQEVKEKTFETLYNYYNQLQVCSNTPSDKEKELLQDLYNDIIWRLQDFDSISFDVDLDLNFDDYEQYKNQN